MPIEINGRTRELETPIMLGELIDAEVTDRRGVAVSLNGEVLPRSDWDTTTVDDGARIEVVGAVQGG